MFKILLLSIKLKGYAKFSKKYKLKLSKDMKEKASFQKVKALRTILN